MTPISMCGVDLEIVTMAGAALDEYGLLARADCTASLADWVSTPWIGDAYDDADIEATTCGPAFAARRDR